MTDPRECGWLGCGLCEPFCKGISLEEWRKQKETEDE